MGDNANCSREEVEEQSRDRKNKVRSSTQLAIEEETHAAFKNLCDTLGNSGVREGAEAFEDAILAAVDWLNLGYELDVCETVRINRKESYSGISRETLTTARMTTARMLARNQEQNAKYP